MFDLTGKGRPEKSGSIRPLMSSIRKKKDEAADEKMETDVLESAAIPVPSTEGLVRPTDLLCMVQAK